MQRNHMGVVRELQAIHGNVDSLHELGDSLITDQPGNENGVREKLKDLDEQWSEVFCLFQQGFQNFTFFLNIFGCPKIYILNI